MGKYIIEVIISRQEHEGKYFAPEKPVIGMNISSTEELYTTWHIWALLSLYVTL